MTVSSPTDRWATAIQRVRGTNDVLPPDDARMRRLEAQLRAGFETFGYAGIQTPILEPLELFLRKSGDEIVARMYSFAHWNRRLCLRPELTASVMRSFVSELHSRALPLRLHYAGPSFRYERPSRGRSRQFTQVGVELIGASGPASDAEVLHLACAGLEAVGIREYRLVVGHLGAALQLLRQLGMSEHAQGLVLDLMEPIARGRLAPDAAVARVVELLGGGPTNGLASHAAELPTPLADLPPEQATAVAADILSRASLPVEGGARQPRHIIQRLLAKANRPDPTDQVRTAFEFVAELHAAAGSPATLQHVLLSLLLSRGLSPTPVEEVAAALRLLEAHAPLSEGATIEVDLSLARGLRYYTGLVFEIYVDTDEGPLQVAGGGRYDDLVRALGGRESVPACGFSYGLERIFLATPSPSSSTEPTPKRILVVGVTSEDHPHALGIARELRTLEGVVVEQDVRLRGVKAALRHADRADMDLVAIVGERERTENQVVLRDMRTRQESTVGRQDMPEAAKRILS